MQADTTAHRRVPERARADRDVGARSQGRFEPLELLDGRRAIRVGKEPNAPAAASMPGGTAAPLPRFRPSARTLTAGAAPARHLRTRARVPSGLPSSTTMIS